jgi:hypothetical protein
MDLESLVLGGTLNFTTLVPDYLPADGWVLKYVLVPRSAGPAAITLTGTQDADDPTLYRIQVAAATTATWTAGNYSWSSWVQKASEKYDLASGVVKFLADPRTATALDTRSDARIALDNVQALLAGRATSGVLSYRIGERQLQNYSMAELLQLESKLKADVRREEDCAAIARGEASSRRMNLRLNRA